MEQRYLVDGNCLDGSIAFKLYLSKQSPVVLNDAVYFPILENDVLTLGTTSVTLSQYLPKCGGDFIAAARSDFYEFAPVFVSLLGVVLVIALLRHGFFVSNTGGTDE